MWQFMQYLSLTSEIVFLIGTCIVVFPKVKQWLETQETQEKKEAQPYTFVADKDYTRARIKQTQPRYTTNFTKPPKGMPGVIVRKVKTQYNAADRKHLGNLAYSLDIDSAHKKRIAEIRRARMSTLDHVNLRNIAKKDEQMSAEIAEEWSSSQLKKKTDAIYKKLGLPRYTR